MPKAEVGSIKYLSNKLKSKGLQRLRWYCQVCEKQCRDANGFKMHTQSESHVRRMLIIGEDPKKYMNDFSNEFLRNFLQLLKTGHGKKQVHINQFYQEYISKKDHIHMNATKWSSLTEFAKYLGRESICRVEETEKGIHISWIDDSPEALRRKEALRKKEAQDQGDEQLEQRIIREQIRRAQAARIEQQEESVLGDRELKRQDGENIKLSLAPKIKQEHAASHGPPSTAQELAPGETARADHETDKSPAPSSVSGSASFTMKMGNKPQAKNVFAQAKKNASAVAAASSNPTKLHEVRPMSEAERIMRQELDRKRPRESNSPFSLSFSKRQRGN